MSKFLILMHSKNNPLKKKLKIMMVLKIFLKLKKSVKKKCFTKDYFKKKIVFIKTCFCKLYITTEKRLFFLKQGHFPCLRFMFFSF